MINHYGADAVRWFILSDSPPDKDVQWSDTGVVASNKYLQKFGIQIFKLLQEKKLKSTLILQKNLVQIEILANKIDKSIAEFKFNVSIAHFYEIYKIFNKYINMEVSNKSLIINLTNTMKLMLPCTSFSQ